VTSRALHTLLHTLIDYAGLFPPAALSMQDAVAAYARHRRSPHAWMLGRFVVPVSRLGEMTDARRAARALEDDHPWRISALLGEDVRGDVAAAAAFNAGGSGAIVDALELKATTVDAVSSIAALVPRDMKVYVEIPVDSDPRERVAAIAAAKLRAKIRTGGVVAGAIPPVEHVARFLRACYAAGVPFKATAGLHHPLRAEQDLTREKAPPRAVMHGFLNVFLAAVLHYNGLTEGDTIDLLELVRLDGVGMDDEKIAWREYVVTVGEVSTIRRRQAIAFGSCSFTDPVDDLVKLGLLA
jgi:hypothetical protein